MKEPTLTHEEEAEEQSDTELFDSADALYATAMAAEASEKDFKKIEKACLDIPAMARSLGIGDKSIIGLATHLGSVQSLQFLRAERLCRLHDEMKRKQAGPSLFEKQGSVKVSLREVDD